MDISALLAVAKNQKRSLPVGTGCTGSGSSFRYVSEERSAALQKGAATGLDVDKDLYRKGEKHCSIRCLIRSHWLKIINMLEWLLIVGGFYFYFILIGAV